LMGSVEAKRVVGAHDDVHIHDSINPAQTRITSPAGSRQLYVWQLSSGQHGLALTLAAPEDAFDFVQVVITV
jgi:hypothetical protein